MKLEIQLFGGRGASSSEGSRKRGSGSGFLNESRETYEQYRERVLENTPRPITAMTNFSNRDSMTYAIKERTEIDLKKAITENQPRPRTGINIDSRKLSINELNSLKSFANRNDIRMESNGTNSYFIWFKKNR